MLLAMKWHRMAPLCCAAWALALGAGCTSRQVCESNADCGADQFCAPDDAEGVSVCGTPCAADLSCTAGKACVLRADGSYEGACLLLVDDVPIGEACTADRDCQSGACEGTGNPVCVEQCTDDLTCDDPAERCVLAGVRRVCVPPSDELPAGAACTDARQCASGTCVNPPDPPQGAPTEPVCADNCKQASDCPNQGDACVRLQGGARACLVPLADGASCQAAGACAGGFCLQDIDGALKCASACVDDACADGFACVDDESGDRVCLPQLDTRAAGEPCTSARECASGHCAHFATDTQELGTLCADACAGDGSCQDGLVCWQDDAGTDVCGPAPAG
jgi:hypothetical protein